MQIKKFDLVDEHELFRRLAEDDERAFDEIYNHYNRRIAPFVQKMVRSPKLTEEIVQDIFVTMWIKRERLGNMESPGAYLYQIASNKTMDYFRKIANNMKVMEHIANISSELSNETEEGLEFKQSQQIIAEAVKSLPVQRKRIWELSRNQGLSHQQIAELMGISKSTVNNQLGHAINHIKSALEDKSALISLTTLIWLFKN